MENVIRNFLKILFWDNDEGNYDYFKASRRNIKNMIATDGSPLEYFKRAEDYDQNGVPDVNMYYRGKTMFDTETTPAGTPYKKQGGSVIRKVKIKRLPRKRQ